MTSSPPPTGLSPRPLDSTRQVKGSIRSRLEAHRGRSIEPPQITHRLSSAKKDRADELQ
jgi:hypothetical protein